MIKHDESLLRIFREIGLCREVAQLRDSASWLKNDIEWTLMEYPELEPVRDKAMDDVSDIDRFLEGLLRNEKSEGRESE